MKYRIACGLYRLIDRACELTGHAGRCWLFNARHPMRWLVDWVVDAAMAPVPPTSYTVSGGTTTYTVAGPATWTWTESPPPADSHEGSQP